MAHPAPARRRQPEADFRADVVTTLRQLGYLVHANRRSDHIVIGAVGLPDILAVHPITGGLLALELKVEQRKPTPAQQAWLAALGRAGVVAAVVEPVDWPQVAQRAAALAGHKVHAR